MTLSADNTVRGRRTAIVGKNEIAKKQDGS
jgi:hypothetical protein